MFSSSLTSYSANLRFYVLDGNNTRIHLCRLKLLYNAKATRSFGESESSRHHSTNGGHRICLMSHSRPASLCQSGSASAKAASNERRLSTSRCEP